VSRLDRVYVCVVCGAMFSNRKGLQGHFRGSCRRRLVHRSFYTDRERWRKFKALCEKHKITTCSLLNEVIDALIAADEKGIPFALGKNPIVINLIQPVGGAARSRRKYKHEAIARARTNVRIRGYRCPECRRSWEGQDPLCPSCHSFGSPIPFGKGF